MSPSAVRPNDAMRFEVEISFLRQWEGYNKDVLKAYFLVGGRQGDKGEDAVENRRWGNAGKGEGGRGTLEEPTAT